MILLCLQSFKTCYTFFSQNSILYDIILSILQILYLIMKLLVNRWFATRVLSIQKHQRTRMGASELTWQWFLSATLWSMKEQRSDWVVLLQQISIWVRLRGMTYLARLPIALLWTQEAGPPLPYWGQSTRESTLGFWSALPNMWLKNLLTSLLCGNISLKYSLSRYFEVNIS